MRTELPRRFFDGFVLKKKDLEDIRDLLILRMEGIGNPKFKYTAKYEVRFKYGAIQERLSIDDILKEPNGDQLTIEGLNISLEDESHPEVRSISLQFSNVKNLPNPMSIYYNIVGTDEGWVNDTDNQLAILIKGVKRFSLDKISQRYFSSSGLVLLLLAFLTLINVTALVKLPEFVYIYFLPVSGIIFAVILVSFLLLQAGRYFFPSYNFVWGTYEKSYKRRRAIGIWIIVVVILGTLLSVLANYISARIGIH